MRSGSHFHGSPWKSIKYAILSEGRGNWEYDFDAEIPISKGFPGGWQNRSGLNVSCVYVCNGKKQ